MYLQQLFRLTQMALAYVSLSRSVVIKAFIESDMQHLTLITEHENSALLNGSLCFRSFDQLFFQASSRAPIMICDPLSLWQFIQNITSKGYADMILQKITDNTTQQESYYEPEFYLPNNHGTSHVSVVAEDGSAVAATSTINV